MRIKHCNSKGMTLLEIVVVVALLGLVIVPITQLIWSIFSATNKESVKADLNQKGRTVLENILYEIRTCPDSSCIKIFKKADLTHEVTGQNNYGDVLKVVNTLNENNSVWYRVLNDNTLTPARYYLLKFPTSASPAATPGKEPSNWKDFILMDKLSSDTSTFQLTIISDNPDYVKYKIGIKLETGKSKNDKVTVNLESQFIKYKKVQ